MNRSQFRERNSRFNIPEQELERMYRIYQEEMLMEQMLMESLRGLSSESCDESGGVAGEPLEEEPE